MCPGCDRLHPACSRMCLDGHTLCNGMHRGCNRMYTRLQPYAAQAATVCIPGTAWPTAIEQYEALRRELYLYNPDYLARPHIVALNKLDLPLQRGAQRTDSLPCL